MNKITDGLKFCSTHEWARLDEDGMVTVGISDFAQEQLGDVVFIGLPQAGQAVRAAAPVATIESVKAASDIHAPVSGEVVAVNTAIESSPESVNEDAWGAWLFRIRPTSLAELDKLLDGGSYQVMVGG